MKKILIVDDDVEISVTMECLLRAEGYGVETANNGWGALDALLEFHPDLVITDVMMPLISGLELVQRIRKIPGFCQMPIILMSSVEPRVRKDDFGWDVFLLKPVSLRALLESVHCLVWEN